MTPYEHWGTCRCGEFARRPMVIWMSNGSPSVVLVCPEGHKSSAIALQRVPDWRLRPVLEDHRDPSKACAYCQRREGVEYHHWAPMKKFGPDWDNWPGAYLCRECHRRWHRTMDGPDHEWREASAAKREGAADGFPAEADAVQA